MTDQTFVDYQTTLNAAYMNDVNKQVYYGVNVAAISGAAGAVVAQLNTVPAVAANNIVVMFQPPFAFAAGATLAVANSNAPAPWGTALPIYAAGQPIPAATLVPGSLAVLVYNAAATRWDVLGPTIPPLPYVFSGTDSLGLNVVWETGSTATLTAAQSGKQIMFSQLGVPITLPAPTSGLNYDLWTLGSTITTPSGNIINQWQQAPTYSMPFENAQHARLVADGTNWHIVHEGMLVATPVTFNVGGSSPNFATMMAAIEWIRQLTVLDGGSVTLYECRASVTEQYAITGLYAPWLTITSSPSLSSGVDLPFATTGYVVLQSGAYNETYNGKTYQFSLTDCVLNIDGTWIYNTTTLSRSLVGQVRGGISVLNGSSFTHTAYTNSCVDVFGGRMFFDGALVAANTSAVANGVSAYAGSDVVVGANASIQAGSPVWTQGGRITTIGANLYLTSGPCLASNSGIIQFESGSLEVLTGCSSSGGLMMAEGAATILVGTSFSIPTWTGSPVFGFVAQYGGIIQYTGSFPAPVAGMVLAQVQYGGTINFQMNAYNGPAAAAYAGKVISGGVIQFAVDPTAIWTDGYNQPPNSITTQGLITAPSASNTPITSAYAATATPIMDGTAAVGSSLDYARQDHVHPSDTSRAALAGSSSQVFSVATATASAHAVPLDQLSNNSLAALNTANNVLDDGSGNASVANVLSVAAGITNQTGMRIASDPTGVYQEADPNGTGINAFYVTGLGGATLVLYKVLADNFYVTGTVQLGVFTVATLPAGTEGMKAIVSDATSPTFLGALTGGGTVVCPVFYNGTAWVVG